MYKGAILLVLILYCSCKKGDVNTTEIIEEVKSENILDESFPEIRKGWKAFHEGDNYHLDIRYATSNNFVHEVLYECGQCFLRTDAAEALEKVAASLGQFRYKLVLFDCYRPKPIQQSLWDKVPNPNYVTPPEKGSMHNRGLAVDLTIMDKNGVYLDMGTEYDFFGEAAHTDNYDHSDEVLKNRKLLKDLMVKYGFKGIRTEWWHFSFVEGSHEIAEWEWECP
jgi:D-alanyl-D-alanine dipeptidase